MLQSSKEFQGLPPTSSFPLLSHPSSSKSTSGRPGKPTEKRGWSKQLGGGGMGILTLLHAHKGIENPTPKPFARKKEKVKHNKLRTIHFMSRTAFCWSLASTGKLIKSFLWDHWDPQGRLRLSSAIASLSFYKHNTTWQFPIMQKRLQVNMSSKSQSIHLDILLFLWSLLFLKI